MTDEHEGPVYAADPAYLAARHAMRRSQGMSEQERLYSVVQAVRAKVVEEIENEIHGLACNHANEPSDMGLPIEGKKLVNRGLDEAVQIVRSTASRVLADWPDQCGSRGAGYLGAVCERRAGHSGDHVMLRRYAG